MRLLNLATTWLLASSSVVLATGGFDLVHEHQGGLFGKLHRGQYCDEDGFVSNGSSVGTTMQLGGGKKGKKSSLYQFF